MHGERAIGPSRGLGQLAGACNAEQKVDGSAARRRKRCAPGSGPPTP